jgi:hypothetical protein
VARFLSKSIAHFGVMMPAEPTDPEG